MVFAPTTLWSIVDAPWTSATLPWDYAGLPYISGTSGLSKFSEEPRAVGESLPPRAMQVVPSCPIRSL